MGHTVAVIDFAHCGTTMLAGVLEMLGVPMVGEHYTKMKWEDLEVIEALKAGGDMFPALVEQRNQAHERWGFKWPGAWKYMDTMQRHLHEPVYLAIYKDPISVSWRRFGKDCDRWVRKVRSTMRRMEESINGIYNCDIPVNLFSYQTALMTPGIFIREVGQAVGIEPTYKQVARIGDYIQPNLGGPRTPYPPVQESL